MIDLKKQTSQILVHILFWMLFIFVSLFMFSRYYWAENPFLQYLSILGVIVYVNHFVLLPFFVKRKWYMFYGALFIAISFFATRLYCDVFAQCGCSIMKCLSDYLWQTLVPLIFFSFIWMLFRFLDEQRLKEDMIKQHAEMELKFLKSQINPHVLFNNLNTIYSYSIEKPNETPELILMLSDNLKHVLYDSNAAFVDLEKELHFLDNYIKFQKIRTEGVKHIEYTTNVMSDYSKIGPLLLITIIENAFKHSTLNSTIFIQLTEKDNTLVCTCINAFEHNNIDNTDSRIGFKNLKKRLDLLYPNKHQLHIEKTDQFKVILTLDLS
ncbi:sensor histidine kinase [Olleya sp. Bg11-27]|uniref:sensor histidine kinase n=1 Tax=Olleya sp. Bg11-27 TaxID=2058135 RepID=UPI001E57ECAC|nr:histidine kinase [Olleya sp. Bg11-27]